MKQYYDLEQLRKMREELRSQLDKIEKKISGQIAAIERVITVAIELNNAESDAESDK